MNLITFLALSDEGAPSFDHRNTEALAALEIPSFACTPDRFPKLMALALQEGLLKEAVNTYSI